MGVGRGGQWVLVLGLLSWTGSGSGGGAAALGQHKAEELSEKQRQELLRQFKDLSGQAVALYQQGRYGAAAGTSPGAVPEALPQGAVPRRPPRPGHQPE
jgi:hypothetical protein